MTEYEEMGIVGTDRFDDWQETCREAGQHAFKKSKKMNLNVMYNKDGDLIEEYPDGTMKMLKKLPPRVLVKKRVVKINNAK